jgi:hypothetical protein
MFGYRSGGSDVEREMSRTRDVKAALARQDRAIDNNSAQIAIVVLDQRNMLFGPTISELPFSTNQGKSNTRLMVSL